MTDDRAEATIESLTEKMHKECKAAWKTDRAEHPDSLFRKITNVFGVIQMVSGLVIGLLPVAAYRGWISTPLNSSWGLGILGGFLVLALVFLVLVLWSRWRDNFGYGAWTKSAAYERVGRNYVSMIGASRSDEIKPFEDRSRASMQLFARIPALAGAAAGLMGKIVEDSHLAGPSLFAAALRYVYIVDIIIAAAIFAAFLSYNTWSLRRFETGIYERARMFSVACGGDFKSGLQARNSY